MENSDTGEVSIESLAAQMSQESGDDQGGLPPEPAAPEPKPDDDTAQRFARIARREREIRKQREALKAEQAEVESVRQLRTTAKQDPKKLLETYGLTIDDVLASAAGIDAPPPEPEDPIASLKREIEEIKAAKKQELEDRAAQELQAKTSQLQTFQNSIKEMIASDGDRYEMIQLHDQADLVWDVIEEQYARDKTVLTAQEAADKVEAYLLEQSQKLLRAKKLQAKPRAKTGEPTLLDLYEDNLRTPRPAAQTSQNKTLSQSMNRMPSVSRQQTAHQSVDDDEAAFQAALKQLKFDA